VGPVLIVGRHFFKPLLIWKTNLFWYQQHLCCSTEVPNTPTHSWNASSKKMSIPSVLRACCKLLKCNCYSFPQRYTHAEVCVQSLHHWMQFVAQMDNCFFRHSKVFQHWVLHWILFSQQATAMDMAVMFMAQPTVTGEVSQTGLLRECPNVTLTYRHNYNWVTIIIMLQDLSTHQC